MTTAADICAFVSQKLPQYQSGRDEPYFQWYLDRTLCGVAKKDGKIGGVAMVRFLDEAKEGLTPYLHKPEGKVTWVELVVSEQGGSIASLFRLLWDRYGRRPFVAYRREFKNGAVRSFPIRMFDKMNALSEAKLALHGGI